MISSEVHSRVLVSLDALLEATAARHAHLCPRQVLGVRMGLFAGVLLDVGVPQLDKRLLAIMETDGCTADGVAVAAGCSVGRRTMRVEDYGKVAATFVDTLSGGAVRIVPRDEARNLAFDYCPATKDRWRAQLIGYQHMPDELLLNWQSVRLITPIERIVGRPDARAVCSVCREEINNGREIVREGRVLCRGCAGHAYYHVAQA